MKLCCNDVKHSNFLNTMALLTNRLDFCIQGLLGAGKSKSMAILILALLELDGQKNSRSSSFAKKRLALDHLSRFSNGLTPLCA